VSLGTPYRFPYSVGYWLTPRTWKRIARHWWQRRTRGFDDSVCWDLQHELAKWLAPRLEVLAGMSSGSPSGYPLDPEDVGYDFETSDHDAWVRDIRKAAEALRRHVEVDTADWWLSKMSADERAEYMRKVNGDASTAMRWISRWWMALWD